MFTSTFIFLLHYYETLVAFFRSLLFDTVDDTFADFVTIILGSDV